MPGQPPVPPAGRGGAPGPPIPPAPGPDEELLGEPGDGQVDARHDDLLVERMADEIERGFRALATLGPAVTVFGSARTPAEHPEYALARHITASIGRHGYAIVTGGGPGLMEAANEGAREAGVMSVGLTIDLPDAEPENPQIDLTVPFRYFFARKIMFVRYAAAFVVFPGGLGTLDELFELMTLIQTHKVRAPPVVLVGRAYWEPLLEWLRDTVLAEGKISPRDLALVTLADDSNEVLAALPPARVAQDPGDPPRI